MTVRKNDDIELIIDGFTSEGSGVGHKDGMAIFVPGGAKGDTVLCHIIKTKKNYAIGKAVKILSPSPDRIESDCPLFPRCGGCAYRHISYAAEAQLKKQRVADCMKRIGGIDCSPDEIITGERLRYRNKAQYPVSAENGEIKIGFYAEKSHRVIDCVDCLLEPSEFAVINNVFREFIKANNISVYDEEAGAGLLRHIYLRKAFATGQTAVTAVINGESLPHSDILVREIVSAVPNVKSVWLNINKERTNTVLGKKCVLIYGNETIEDELCGLKINLHPLSFYQVNRAGAEKLYQKAAELLSPSGDETVLDLYCGAGTIGLSMASKIKKLIGVEIVPEAVENARSNAAANGIDNAEFICADAEQAAEMLEKRGIKPDAVILDPPRKGCGKTLPETVARMNPKKIIYISCDPATLARDCAVFKTLGWHPVKITPADMFPATAHVETVVLLQNNNK